MYGEQLAVSSEEKYLGVIINDKLSWSSHVEMIVNDSCRKLGLVRRVFGNCDKDIKTKLYNQLVKTKLEFVPLCGTRIILVNKDCWKRCKSVRCALYPTSGT